VERSGICPVPCQQFESVASGAHGLICSSRILYFSGYICVRFFDMRKKNCIAAYVYARSLDSCIKYLLPRFRRLLLFSINYHNLFRESKNSRMPSDGACLSRLFSKTKMPSMWPVWCLPSFPPRFSRNPKIVKNQ
jgi:hypothetical protein